MNQIITIGRQFGSGGHEIGFRLADALRIPFYDKLLVSMVAEEGEFAREYLEEMDEKFELHIAPFLATRSSYSVYQQPMSDKIFFRQAEIIRNLAHSGPCVIVGRCADYVLEGEENLIRVFLYADLEDRVERKNKLGLEVPQENMEKHILSTDRRRARYYRHYTGRTWGDRENYDLCINTSRTDIDGAVALIRLFAEMRDKQSASENQ
ncbi:MAG: cytidylate kinase-like family protein [Lachnospiraceae bacterium]|nr:cytidylate kinase-like family protein [Lachnospiraceae bacterium]